MATLEEMVRGRLDLTGRSEFQFRTRFNSSVGYYLTTQTSEEMESHSLEDKRDHIVADLIGLWRYARKDKTRRLVRSMLKDTCLEDVEHFDTRYSRSKKQYESTYTLNRRDGHSDDFKADWIAYQLVGLYGYKTIFDKS
ncbi:hypothetical protein LCGC14_1571290 [marine sediment metagenome]|uniref:Uncharacterized protein n=1 Tax=marine sediment metagenome TaxID=412755 RepID=A0A0F9IJJ9_9ZZZZ